MPASADGTPEGSGLLRVGETRIGRNRLGLLVFKDF
jgi:hypothetical protein